MQQLQLHEIDADIPDCIRNNTTLINKIAKVKKSDMTINALAILDKNEYKIVDPEFIEFFKLSANTTYKLANLIILIASVLNKCTFIAQFDCYLTGNKNFPVVSKTFLVYFVRRYIIKCEE